MSLEIIQLSLVNTDLLLKLQLILIVNLVSFSKLFLKTSVLIHLRLYSLLDFLLSMNEIQIAFLKLSEDFEHLIRFFEVQMLFSQMIGEVNQVFT